MPDRIQNPQQKPVKSKPAKLTPAIQQDQAVEASVEISPNLVLSGEDPTCKDQARLLNNPCLQAVQRQELTRQIAHLLGNRHLQAVLNVMPRKHQQSSQHSLSPIQRYIGLNTPESGGEASGVVGNQVDQETAHRRATEMLQGGERGWHATLPQSGLRARSIRFRPGDRENAPGLRGSYPQQPSMTDVEDPVESAARQLVIEDIRNRLSRITAPTESGEMGTFRGGYVYRAREAAAAGNERSAAHQQFMNDAVLESVGLDPGNRQQAVMWRQFHYIIVHEGDTAAINAWDNQILTIGAGFSQRYGAAGAIYNRMPAAFRQRLYEHGIMVNEDNSFTVLDLDRGVVETGRNALRLIQVNPQMLSLLVQEAQSQTEMSEEGESMTERQWILRAQFEQFLENNSDIPASALSWPENSIRFALLLKHWQGALGWRGMGRSNGNPNAIASYALRTIRRVHGGEWTAEYIQGRISGLARDAGVGAVAFQSVSD